MSSTAERRKASKVERCLKELIVDSVPQLWSPKDVAHLRAKTNGWSVRIAVGRRSVRCKACGDTIPKGEKRLNAKHLILAGRNSYYDLVGFVCVDAEMCQDNLVLFSCIDSVVADAEKLLAADPTIAEGSHDHKRD